jgi:hypothetical protein
MVKKLGSDCLELKSRFDISAFAVKKAMIWKLNNSIRLILKAGLLIRKHEIITGLVKVLDSV